MECNHYLKIEDNVKELPRNVVIAASSLIPGVGGVLSLFLDKYLPSTIEKRREEFLIKLSSDMEQLPKEVISLLATNEEYHSIIIKVFREVTQENQEIKINAFRNILINTALHLGDKTNENEFYIRLVSELTSDQMKILQLFYRRDKKGEVIFTDINKYITENYPNIDSSYRFTLVTELLRTGIISGAQGIQKQKGEGHHLSDFGERFIDFVFTPNEIQDTLQN